MGKAKKAPKFAVMKKLVTSKAIKQHKEEILNPNKKDLHKEKLPRNVIAKDHRFERLPCTHKGTYADDCIVDRVTQVSGVPIMYITKHQYSIERLPEATIGGAPRI
ncbi:PIN domain-like family protein [Actinidia rufa]|uniref:PIN domain-like family protein n=1 Tax=Actinidia rufa TaxID=165716 RepID=A0A7J0F1A6_9ERIC|nr:PIN domain-like family protein [Actinidia rufa]